ncbi:hypothetical protein PLCT2_00741 [Planctomycetaceae bacterium]|nr:hypothetical protein PLCT2_00741 [Planctomycetaceae bacterium]
MRTSVTCSVCSYRFHLPVSNVHLIEACPACEAPKSSLRLPAVQQPSVPVRSVTAASSARWKAVAEKPAARPVRLPQPRRWRNG